MHVDEIVDAGLRKAGFDGLVVPDVCGCAIGNLSPAGCLSESCEAGYKHMHSQRPEEWIISTRKDGITDTDIERCIADCC